MKTPDPFCDAKVGGRIIRRPAQPRSNLARFRRRSELVSLLREALEMSPAGRRRVYEEIMAEVVEEFAEMAGDSLVKIEKVPGLGNDSGSGEAPADLGNRAPIIVPAAQGRG